MKEIKEVINIMERCLEVSEAVLDFFLHVPQVADHFIDHSRGHVVLEDSTHKHD